VKHTPENGRPLLRFAVPIGFALLLIASAAADLEAGQRAAGQLGSFGLQMLKIVPFAFILIGLFEVWVPKRVVERHMGEQAGLRAHLWGILLAGTTVGGLYVSFPVAAALQRKGARLTFLLSYIGASGVCRIPMTLFEASFLGITFTLIRYAVAVPLIVLSSELLGRYLERRHFQMRE
jgi:uncharacterized membrane protein YraQ (UPF0718 family)